MIKYRSILSILLVLVLMLVAFAGCASEQEEPVSSEESESSNEESSEIRDETENLSGFSYSEGISESGYWEGITALDYVELFDYASMQIPSDVHTVSDEALRHEVNTILSEFSSELQVTDRPVEIYDTVNIDYVGSVDGVEFQGGSTGGAGTDVIIGVTSYIDDFLEQLIGHTPGETFNVEVTFPEEYGVEELNGQDAIFVTTINYIVENDTPELNDEFVANNLLGTGWSTVEEMNQSITEDLQKSALMNYATEYLMDNVQVSSVPDQLISYVEGSLVNYYQEGADYYGVGIEDMLGMYVGVSSVDELLEVYAAENVEQAQYYLAMQAIAEDAEIVVTDEDITAYFVKYVGTDDYSEYAEQYGMPYIRQSVLNQLALDHLISQAVLV